MMKREDEPPQLYTATWPFPVGSWILPLFWLVILLLASLLWLFD